MSSAALIGASLAVPMAGAVLILMSDARPNQREGATLVTAGVLFACVMALLPRVLAGERPTLTLLEPVAGLPISFTAEPLGMIFAAVAGDFYKIDPMLFSPARVTVSNLDTGQSFHGGALAPEIVDASFRS